MRNKFFDSRPTSPILPTSLTAVAPESTTTAPSSASASRPTRPYLLGPPSSRRECRRTRRYLPSRLRWRQPMWSSLFIQLVCILVFRGSFAGWVWSRVQKGEGEGIENIMFKRHSLLLQPIFLSFYGVNEDWKLEKKTQKMLNAGWWQGIYKGKRKTNL